MHTKSALMNACSMLGAAAVASTFLAGNVVAEDRRVTVSKSVSTRGLDLSQPADARKFYARLENAAWMVCTVGNRVDLLPADDLKGCYEKALGGAVRSAKKPMVTQIYLVTHTLQEAAAHGIEVSAEIAAR